MSNSCKNSFNTKDKPLLSLLILSYNHEKFIEDAILGALSQTYSPLEIIISDDSSIDNTFEIICTLTSNYAGPHKIVLNRNSENLGIGKHVNKLFSMANGELLVLSAGDDISERHRCSELAKFWLNNNKQFDSIYSDVTIINNEGVKTGEKSSPISNDSPITQTINMVPYLLGCSHATTKRLHQKFGEIGNDITYEDRAIAYRALWTGGIGHLDKTLVRYRIHDNSVTVRVKVKNDHKSSRIRIKNHLIHLQRERSVIAGYLSDLAEIPNATGLEAALKIMQEENLINTLMCSEIFSERINGIKKFIISKKYSVKSVIRNFAKLINPTIWFRYR